MKTKYTTSETYFFTQCAENKVIEAWEAFSEWFKQHEFVKCVLLENNKGEQFYLKLTL